jgi:hypothetical protein
MNKMMLAVCLLLTNLWAADKDKPTRMNKPVEIAKGPVVAVDYKYHKIGTLWSRVSNFGKTGDDSYTQKTASCDWPGGSGNSYLYRGSIWITAKVNGVVRCSQPEQNEYSPLDSVHVFSPGIRGEQETYTRYYDLGGRTPLGVEVTERTYSWSESFRDDFIIYEFTIKNIGIDTNADGYADTDRDLQEFYFTYRLDGDVSKLSDWPVEGAYVNFDDLAGINVSWDFIDLFFPEWAVVDHGLTAENADTTLMFMFDADNPNVPSEIEGEDNDLGNPIIQDDKRILQTPGFLGIKMLKTVPSHFRVSRYKTDDIYDQPSTDQQAYDRVVGQIPGIDPFESQGPSGIVLVQGKPDPYDYRAFMTIGPLETLSAGDSVVITLALGVGADPERGGIYSLVELVNIMDVAQLIVDANYEIASLAPPTPEISVDEYISNGSVAGVEIRWNDAAESNVNFQSYKVWKSSEKDASGAYVWELLATYVDSTESTSWPPPPSETHGEYLFIDTDVITGFDYVYSVQSFSIELPPPFGVLESNILNSLKVISPANPAASNLDRIKVVPNPYIGSSEWNNPIPSDVDPWQHRLQFINLPADATIKIFTLDGDFVEEIRAGQGVRQSESFISETANSVAEWDLITRSDQEAAPGIYLYVVESPSAGEKIGKFVIVR